MKWRAEAPLLALTLTSCVGGSTDRRPPTREVSDAAVRVGQPYTVHGRTYAPLDDPGYSEIGRASWYGAELAGRATANGEAFDPGGISAAHRTLPLPSYVRVTDLDSGRSVVARVNDRGPFASDRIIDLSQGAARLLGLTGDARVRVERVEPDEEDRVRLRRGQPTRADAGRAAFTPSPVALLPPGTRWSIQLGAFSSRARAVELADRAGATIVSGGGVHRVRVGPFTDPDAVRRALARLHAAGYDAATVVTP